MKPSLFPGAQVDPLTPEQVRTGLRGHRFGQEVLYYPTVGSTNDVAREQARGNAPEGILVLAEEQTAGRGRRGRHWEAPFGSSILASLLLRPSFLPPQQSFLLTALAALAIAEAITKETGLEASLKWPNDILIGVCKVCGILIELGPSTKGTTPSTPSESVAAAIKGPPESSQPADPARLSWAVLGWGLNVNTDFSKDPDMDRRATSLAEAAGRPFPRLPLLWACLERLEAYYEQLRAGSGEEIWRTWRARLYTLGRPVVVTAPEGSFSGVALDVDHDGALLVRRDDGTAVRVLAGDVELRA